MKSDQHLVTNGWEGYELLDSGENMKLERFGEVVVARPETQALWAKLKPELWGSAHALFAFRDSKGSWEVKKQIPDVWEVPLGSVTCLARLTGFKHVGIFPEQEPNWKWVAEQCRTLRSRVGTLSERGEEARDTAPKVLNLFGYTGAASLVAAHSGGLVTHVDSSKQSLDWAHENARRSKLGEDKIRWILDDALAFVKREARRGAKYDGIILDPPAFGRGAKGEVWKIEEDLPKLLEALKGLLSEKLGSFFLLNGYAAGYAPLSFVQAVESVFGNVLGESGELRIQESQTNRAIPAGIYVRFVR